MELPGGESSRPQRATRGAMAAAAAAKAEAAAGPSGFGRELSLNVLQGHNEQAPPPLHKKGTAAAGTSKGAWMDGLVARSTRPTIVASTGTYGSVPPPSSDRSINSLPGSGRAGSGRRKAATASTAAPVIFDEAAGENTGMELEKQQKDKGARVKRGGSSSSVQERASSTSTATAAALEARVAVR